jgi:hypothetical protein
MQRRPATSGADDVNLEFSLRGLTVNTRRDLVENLCQQIHTTERWNMYFGPVAGLGGNTTGQVRDKLGEDVSDGDTYECIAEVTPDPHWLTTLMPLELVTVIGRGPDGCVRLPPDTYFLQGHAEMFSHLQYKNQKGCSLYRQALLKEMVSVSGAPSGASGADANKMMFVPFVLDPTVEDVDNCVWKMKGIFPDVYGENTEEYELRARREWHKYKCVCSHDNHAIEGLEVLEPRLYVSMQTILMRQIAKLRQALAAKDFVSAKEVIFDGGERLVESDALKYFRDTDVLRECRYNRDCADMNASGSFHALRWLERGLWEDIWQTADERLIFCFGSTCKDHVTFTNANASDTANTRSGTRSARRQRIEYESLYEVVQDVLPASR